MKIKVYFKYKVKSEKYSILSFKVFLSFIHKFKLPLAYTFFKNRIPIRNSECLLYNSAFFYICDQIP